MVLIILCPYQQTKRGSSVKWVDAFRIALKENRSHSLNKNIAKTIKYLSYYHPLTLKTISFKTSKICRQVFEKLLHNF